MAKEEKNCPYRVREPRLEGPVRLLKNLETYIFVILSEAKNLVFSGS
jgi:hypothetical protein